MAEVDIIKKADEAQRRFESLAKTNMELEKQIESNTKFIKNSEKEVAAMRSAVATLKAQITEQEEVRAELGSENSKTIADIQNKTVEREIALNAKEQSLNALSEELHQEAERMKKEQAVIGATRRELEKLSNEIATTKAEVDNQLANAKKYSERCADKSIAIETMQRELEETVKEANARADKMAKEEASVAQRKIDNEKLMEALMVREAALIAKDKEVKAEADRIASERAEADAKIKEALGRIEEAKDVELAVKAQEAKLNAIIRKKNLENEIKAA